MHQLNPDKLNQHLSLYRVDEVKHLETLAESELYTSFLISAGPQNAVDDFILCWFHNMGFDELPISLKLINHLNQQELPAWSPLATLDGMITTIFQNHPTLLFNPAEGTCEQTPNDDQCRAAAQLLARFHLLDYPDQLQQRAPKGVLQPEIHEQTIQTMQNQAGGLSDAARVESQSSLQLISGYQEQLPRGLCHRNPIRTSVSFLNSDPTSIQELYWSGNDYFSFDLALMICDWCNQEDRLDSKKVSACLQGYESFRKLSDPERHCLPAFINLAGLQLFLNKGPQPEDVTPWLVRYSWP